jgi:hypothetical protein
MKRVISRAVLWLACSAGVCAPADPSRIYVTSAASSLVEQGLAAAAPTGSEAAAFQEVPGPAVRIQANESQATTAPWIDSNAWRFQRGMQKANYAKLAAGSAPLAAAEAFTFNVDAILNPDPADLQELGRMLGFLKTLAQPPMPALANIEIVDNHSPAMKEVLNMLTRRNLLYRVVSAPDHKLDLTVQLGTKDFPKESAENPSDFAARVRAKLGDDKRLVRLYGTSAMIARLTGDGKHVRLYLLSYGRGRGQGGGQGRGRGGQGGGQQSTLRIRVLGRYQPTRFLAYGAADDAKLLDVENPGKTTEFSVPLFNTLAVIDLEAK